MFLLHLAFRAALALTNMLEHIKRRERFQISHDVSPPALLLSGCIRLKAGHGISDKGFWLQFVYMIMHVMELSVLSVRVWSGLEVLYWLVFALSGLSSY